jgi:hypothetical protein
MYNNFNDMLISMIVSGNMYVKELLVRTTKNNE